MRDACRAGRKVVSREKAYAIATIIPICIQGTVKD